MIKPCATRDRLIIALALAANGDREHSSGDDNTSVTSAPSIRDEIVKHCLEHGC